MKKVILTILGAALLTAGLLSSTVADPTLDQAKESRKCLARLHMCFVRADYEALLENPPTGFFECQAVCNDTPNPPGEACGVETCIQLCKVAFQTVVNFCPTPPSIPDACEPPDPCGGGGD